MDATNFLHGIVKDLVSSPESIVIDEKHDDLGILLSLKISPDDMGIIIGKHGKTIDSLRTLVRIYGSKKNERVNLRVVEEKGQV